MYVNVISLLGSGGNPIVCNFNISSDTCGLTEVTMSQNIPTNDGKPNWQWRNMRTPSSNTGPSYDHTTQQANSGRNCKI